jgi:hypothetical protein
MYRSKHRSALSEIEIMTQVEPSPSSDHKIDSAQGTMMISFSSTVRDDERRKNGMVTHIASYR